MQACPKCGFRKRFDWYSTVSMLVVTTMFLVVVLAPDHAPIPKTYRLTAIGAYALFAVSDLWKYLWDKRASGQ
jgi:hypothetical protein